MLGDLGQWLHHIEKSSPSSAIAFVLLRVTMFRYVRTPIHHPLSLYENISPLHHHHHHHRSIGLIDALIFGGAFDVCLDRSNAPKDGSSHHKNASSQDQSSFAAQQQYYPSLNNNSAGTSTAPGGIALMQQQRLPSPSDSPSGGVDGRLDDDNDEEEESSDMPKAFPALHQGASPFGAASGLKHEQSVLAAAAAGRGGGGGNDPPVPVMVTDGVSELTDPGTGAAPAIIGTPQAPLPPVKSKVKIFASTYNGKVS
jgi:hypothetical protein